ncbi:hypothetical protein B566_EDAN007245 [Ephemera danica]|nr:hypothetical protein B566_EDAN007245 [Ephemera danica]
MIYSVFITLSIVYKLLDWVFIPLFKQNHIFKEYILKIIDLPNRHKILHHPVEILIFAAKIMLSLFNFNGFFFYLNNVKISIVKHSGTTNVRKKSNSPEVHVGYSHQEVLILAALYQLESVFHFIYLWLYRTMPAMCKLGTWNLHVADKLSTSARPVIAVSSRFKAGRCSKCCCTVCSGMNLLYKGASKTKSGRSICTAVCNSFNFTHGCILFSSETREK